MPPEYISIEHLGDALKDAQHFMDYLAQADEDELAFIWRVRNNLHKERTYKLRTMLWDELAFRYDGLGRKPLELRMP